MTPNVDRWLFFRRLAPVTLGFAAGAILWLTLVGVWSFFHELTLDALISLIGYAAGCAALLAYEIWQAVKRYRREHHD